jgi:hypothetical protein
MERSCLKASLHGQQNFVTLCGTMPHDTQIGLVLIWHRVPRGTERHEIHNLTDGRLTFKAIQVAVFLYSISKGQLKFENVCFGFSFKFLQLIH